MNGLATATKFQTCTTTKEIIMNAKASSYFAGGIMVLLGAVALLMGHLSSDRYSVIMITVAGTLALSHVIGKFK